MAALTWLSELARLASQPLELTPVLPTMPSQFAKPLLQAIKQFPFVQDPVPFCALHTLPQPAFAPPPAPQLFLSVSVFTSHPFELAPVAPTTPSQFPNPGLQVIVQLPAAHDGVPFWVLHTLPQPAAEPCPLLIAPPGPQFVTPKVAVSQP